MKIKKLLLTLFVVLFSATAYSQTDSLILINGDIIIGELKDMTKNVVTFETPYSDKDFKIEWDGVKEIYTERIFLIDVVEGKRYTGRILTTSPKKVKIIGEEGVDELNIDDIIFFDEFGGNFLSNFYANIDLGLNITKANKFKQFNVALVAGYLARKWSADSYFNILRSNQDDTNPIQRTGGGANYRYFLPKNWYVSGALDLLSNTEQVLQLRTTVKTGVGYFVFRNNDLFWGFGAGGSLNNENYTNDTPKRTSFELYIASDFTLINIPDFDLTTNIFVYPSLTESGRWRVDYLINTKYDLPMDFYVGLNFTLNYDNQPAEIGKEVDYVFGVSFGWEWP